jgi:hypothetical protein
MKKITGLEDNAPIILNDNIRNLSAFTAIEENVVITLH